MRALFCCTRQAVGRTQARTMASSAHKYVPSKLSAETDWDIYLRFNTYTNEIVHSYSVSRTDKMKACLTLVTQLYYNNVKLIGLFCA